MRTVYLSEYEDAFAIEDGVEYEIEKVIPKIRNHETTIYIYLKKKDLKK